MNCGRSVSAKAGCHHKFFVIVAVRSHAFRPQAISGIEGLETVECDNANGQSLIGQFRW